MNNLKILTLYSSSAIFRIGSELMLKLLMSLLIEMASERSEVRIGDCDCEWTCNLWDLSLIVSSESDVDCCDCGDVSKMGNLDVIVGELEAGVVDGLDKLLGSKAESSVAEGLEVTLAFTFGDALDCLAPNEGVLRLSPWRFWRKRDITVMWQYYYFIQTPMAGMETPLTVPFSTNSLRLDVHFSNAGPSWPDNIKRYTNVNGPVIFTPIFKSKLSAVGELISQYLNAAKRGEHSWLVSRDFQIENKGGIIPIGFRSDKLSQIRDVLLFLQSSDGKIKVISIVHDKITGGSF
jgi:hypothetical protein